MVLGVRVEIAVRNRMCQFCEVLMPKGTECVKFLGNPRSICMPCFKENCLEVFGPDAFSTKFKAKIMAEKV
jgi:hypothetical protein